MARHGQALENYMGPDQAGGITDPITHLLALLFHAQYKEQTGAGTYWAVGAIKWAFDVANIPAMLWHTLQAGITLEHGCRWTIFSVLIRKRYASMGCSLPFLF